MKLNVNQAIEQIAEKLGVAVEKVYPILYKQALIEGVISLVGIILIVGFFWLTSGYMRAYYRVGKEEKDWLDDTWIEALVVNVKGGVIHFFALLGLVITSIVGVIALPTLLSDVITAFFNTDYYIINDVLDKLR